MFEVEELVNGYRRFRSGRYPREAEIYHQLAKSGQSPNIMVIACCDSRADPALIFNAGPGQLFIVRNVANLVPPFAHDGEYHGTGAALEYAVEHLTVAHIVVLGHARCGGVETYLNAPDDPAAGSHFIADWISMLDGAYTSVAGGKPVSQTALEHASIQRSVANLRTFPFIAERVNAGALQLHGAYFSIADGLLLALNPANQCFEPVAA